MYLDKSRITVRGTTYSRVLLRQSYRENGKVKHRTIANLSACSPEEIQGIELAFKHKKDLESLTLASEGPLHLRQGLSLGAVWALHQVADRLGIVGALGSDRPGKLALWQVLARAIDQGSRLSAVRLAGSHAACDVLGLGPFNEDQLYPNLAWLAENQAVIEQRLFEHLHPDGCPGLFLYDVTSSYLERKFRIQAVGNAIVKCSSATSCPGFLQVLLSGHEAPGTAQFFGQLYLGQLQ
jgi:hypothetical protein